MSEGNRHVSANRGSILRTSANLVAVTLVLLALCTATSAEETSREAPSIAPAEIVEQRGAGKAPVLIDVRTAQEYAAGHIPGAINIPYDEVAARISEVDAPHGVALYCMVGPRARKGESALLEIDYEKVLHLEGGMAAWQAAGLPLEK
jgi:phage shock protein E